MAHAKSKTPLHTVLVWRPTIQIFAGWLRTCRKQNSYTLLVALDGC